MKKRMTSLFLALALCLTLLPAAALAADEDAPDTLLVGGTNVKGGGYWTTTSGTLASSDVNTWSVHYDTSTNTLTLKNADITGAASDETLSLSVGIYAYSSSGDVSLNIELQGVNEIFESSYGIWVYSYSSSSSTNAGNATLTIEGEGSLNASGSSSGILVQSNGGDATLTIQNADVTAENSSPSGDGVTVRAGSSSSASLSVNGGSLTATGKSEYGAGIRYTFGGGSSGSGVPSLNVSNSAIVKASSDTGGITSNSSPVTPSGTGIVFNNGTGTVYGNVELQKDLEIKSGETLTIPDGASLTIGNDATLTVDGGELTGSVTGTVIYKVTEVKLDKTSLTLDVGASDTLTATITPDKATNKNVTWSSSNASVATVENGVVTAVGAGTATITATVDGKSATCTVTVTAPPEPTPPPYIPPTYAVTVPDTTGGTVEVSPSRASSGRTVTITTQPAPGYELESLTVLDSRDSEIALTAQGDGKYTFTMPSRKVTVQASFAPVPLPFEDVPPGAWYEEAVRYAYTHGIMEGMSATKFSPNISLTRAQAVQVLYNLEGQPVVSESATFPDLVYEWYKPAIAWAESTGVVDGYEDGTFRPTDSITRQEFAQMLYNYAKYKGYDLTAEGDLAQFPDSGSVADWAKVAMSWANGNALINGHDDGTLEPGGTTIRAQAASILMRFDQKLVE